MLYIASSIYEVGCQDFDTIAPDDTLHIEE